MSEVVFVVPGRLDQLTGGYLYDRHIVEGLRARGRAVDVIELGPNGPAARFGALADGVIVVVDGLALPIVAGVIAQHRRRLRLLALVHHPLSQETGQTPAALERVAQLEAALLPQFQGVICPSGGTAAAVERSGVPPSRITVIPPGTQKPLFPRRPRRGRARALLCVASLVPRKGHDVLLEALMRVDDLDWELLCVGSLQRDPPTTRKIRRMIAAAGLDRRVILAGERSPQQVARAYRAADVFVLPSFHEGYGMAYAEAIAHGLPIIGTTAGAIPATVPPQAGLLVRPGDAAALARALRRVIAEPAVTAQLAAGSRSAGACLPDWRQATDRWVQALDRVAPANSHLFRVEHSPVGMSQAASADNPAMAAVTGKP